MDRLLTQHLPPSQVVFGRYNATNHQKGHTGIALLSLSALTHRVAGILPAENLGRNQYDLTANIAVGLV